MLLKTVICEPKSFEGDTLALARFLPGCFLCKNTQDGVRRFIITEVEAYDGFHDKASHAHRGKTKRNAVMFGPGGYWYVYLCYGIHWMLNLVTGVIDYPAAILIRGVDGFSGPGRLTKNLGIDQSFNQKPTTKEYGLWIERSATELQPPRVIRCTPRIGIDYAGPIWAKKPYRFLLEG